MVYKASLLHLQPRQMRLEITDMQNEGNDDDADEDDEVDGLFAPEFAGNVTTYDLFQHIFIASRERDAEDGTLISESV